MERDGQIHGFLLTVYFGCFQFATCVKDFIIFYELIDTDRR